MIYGKKNRFIWNFIQEIQCIYVHVNKILSVALITKYRSKLIKEDSSWKNFD